MYMLYMGIECVRGWNVEYLTSKTSVKLKQYYYFHAEFFFSSTLDLFVSVNMVLIKFLFI